MAIPLPDQSGTPAGDFVNRQVLGEVVADLITGIAGAMVHAGWTSQVLAATNWLVTTGQPANNNTVTIDGVVYTFKTVINNGNAREVLIGATWQDTLQSLVHAINDDGVGEGTSYSSATTAHSTCTASYRSSDGAVFISSVAAGPGVTGILVSEGMANSSFAWATRLYYGGYRLTSARSPDGHQMCVDLREYGGTVLLHFGDAFRLPGPGASAEYDGVKWNAPSALYALAPAAGRYFRVIASMYSVWACVPGTSGNGTAFGASLVKMPDARMQAPLISAASGGDGSVVLVTQAAHGMVGTGNVYIQGAQGLVIDGFWNVTVVDQDTYTLDDSEAVPAGTYVGDSARAANVNAGQISQAYFGWCMRSGTANGFRLGLDSTTLCNVQRVNQYGWTGTEYSGAGQWRIPYQTALRWFDARYWVQEAPVFCGEDSTSSTQGVGWLWGAFLLAKNVPGDAQATDSDGQRWFAYTMQNSAAYTLMLAVPPTEN